MCLEPSTGTGIVIIWYELLVCFVCIFPFSFSFFFYFCFVVETMEEIWIMEENNNNGFDLSYHGYMIDRTMIGLPLIGSCAAPEQPITPIGST